MKTLRMYRSVEIDGATTSSFTIGAHELGGVTEEIESTPVGVSVRQTKGKQTRALLVTPMGVCVEEWAAVRAKPVAVAVAVASNDAMAIPKRRPGRPRKTHA